MPRPLSLIRSMIALAGLALAALDAAAQTTGTAGGESELTIYRNDLALVTTRRAVALEAGEATIALAQVSPGIVRPSLDLTASGVRLIEQVFPPWPLSRQRLLEAYVGERVVLVRPTPDGEGRVETDATLLSVDGGIVVRTSDGHIEADPDGRIQFPELPDELSATPRVRFRIAVAEAGTKDLRFRYLTQGVSWTAHYVVHWDDAAGTFDLTGTASVESALSAPVSAQQVRLVAGEVRVAAGEPTPHRPEMRATAVSADQLPVAETRADLKIYTLDRPLTLAPHTTVQRPLLSVEDVAATRRYRVEGLALAQPTTGWREAAARLRLLVPDTRAAGIDEALPAGLVRVYDGALFRGAQAIDDTPSGGALTLDLGTAFDVTARARQTAFERIGERTYETAQEVVVRNARNREVSVQILGRFPSDWRMLSESHRHEIETAREPLWTLTVPAKGETTLSYRVRVGR